MSPEEIKNLRKSRHETQTEFAITIGTYQCHISRWERGIQIPRGLYLKALLDLKKLMTK